MDQTFDDLKRAGAEALQFNAPLGDVRADAAYSFISKHKVLTAVDLGCGRGNFLRGMLRMNRPLRGVGLDLDSELISFARAVAVEEGLSDQVVFEVADAKEFRGPVDVAICIGSSHIFGGSAPMFAHLADIVPDGIAIVGDGVWDAPPDQWCESTFGVMPNGVEALATMAEGNGWIVDAADTSTIDEWDQFEGQWSRGVEAVGTPSALRFAGERTEEYQRYRGILGFAWLHLRRK